MSQGRPSALTKIIIITSGRSSAGNCTGNFCAAPNTNQNARTGTRNIAGQTFTITQIGWPCAASPITAGQTLNGTPAPSDCGSLVLESLAFAADLYTFTGTAGQLVSVALNSTAFDPYLYLLGPNGAVLVEDDDGGDGLNARIPARSGFFRLPASGAYTVEVTSFDPMSAGGYTLSLNVTTCAYVVAPLQTQRFEAAGVNGSATVTAAGGCEWSAASNVAWLTLSVGALGAGNGSVSFNAALKPTAQSRTGTTVVTGQTITVVQAGTLIESVSGELPRRGVGERADSSGVWHGIGHGDAI